MVFVGDISIVNGGYKPSCGEVGCENATKSTRLNGRNNIEEPVDCQKDII